MDVRVKFVTDTTFNGKRKQQPLLSGAILHLSADGVVKGESKKGKEVENKAENNMDLQITLIVTESRQHVKKLLQQNQNKLTTTYTVQSFGNNNVKQQSR